MNSNVESLQRAAKKVVDHLVALTEAVNKPRYQAGVERESALSDAQAVRIIAAALYGAADTAAEALKPAPPPAQHHHSHHPPLPRGPITSAAAVNVSPEHAGPTTQDRKQA